MRELYNLSPTNHMGKMQYPDGISSDVFKGMYFDALSFAASYNKDSYESLRPHTTKYLKMRY